MVAVAYYVGTYIGEAILSSGTGGSGTGGGSGQVGASGTPYTGLCNSYCPFDIQAMLSSMFSDPFDFLSGTGLHPDEMMDKFGHPEDMQFCSRSFDPSTIRRDPPDLRQELF